MSGAPTYVDGHGLLAGKRVLVTAAAGTGIGFQAAQRCVEEGATVVVSDKHERRTAEAAERLGVVGIPCDVTVESDVRGLVDGAVAAMGGVDVFINNAGLGGEVPIVDMTDDQWDLVLDVTLTATFRCLRAELQYLYANGGGVIVNNASVLGWRAQAGQAHYAAAKAGVKNMVETLAVEWGPYGIQVNGLVPGLFPHEDVTAEIQGNLARTNDKDVCQPALRVGRPRELGWAATFLASPYARFISGHTLVVDGANWQRRSLTNPAVVTVRDQMGKGPFEP